jgi:hypothetical protein
MSEGQLTSQWRRRTVAVGPEWWSDAKAAGTVALIVILATRGNDREGQR